MYITLYFYSTTFQKEILYFLLHDVVTVYKMNKIISTASATTFKKYLTCYWINNNNLIV